jgi:hypothetical protein
VVKAILGVLLLLLRWSAVVMIATFVSPSSLQAQVLQFMERWQGNIPGGST